MKIESSRVLLMLKDMQLERNTIRLINAARNLAGDIARRKAYANKWWEINSKGISMFYMDQMVVHPFVARQSAWVNPK